MAAVGPRIRRVLLVYPRSGRYSGLLSTNRMPGLVTAHAGLTILAQLLERRGIAVRVIDESLTPLTDGHLDGVDLVGISIQTSWSLRGYRIARRARALGLPVVIGGVHATLNPDEAIAHADWVVRGEGEQALLELVAAIESGEGFERILGLSYRQQGVVRRNPDRPPMSEEELDRVPWPCLERIEGFSDPLRHPLSHRLYFTMLTRGCDQACTYCSIIRVFGRALRRRKVASVIEELGARFDPKREHLFLMDDSLAVDKDYLKAVLDGLRKHRLVPRLGWHSQMRADVASDPELVRLMRETNCMFVTCGFESVDDKSLRALGKGQTERDVQQAIATLRDNGIAVNGFFMFGTDHDRPETISRTLEFAKRSGCTLAGFMPLTPFPGTPVHKQLEREERIFTKNWELYDVQHVVFRPRQMSALELYWRTLSCYPAFYGPSYYSRGLTGALGRRVDPFVVAVGALWPLAKQLSWAREVGANLDYLLALRRLERRGGRELLELGAA
jgi:anaerobic magnesium-protoporphyrin IX monomethyl ester cyclase